MNDGYWAATWIYLAGVLTGAALMGWSPAWLERWGQQRREREERRSSDRMRRILKERGLLPKDDPTDP